MLPAISDRQGMIEFSYRSTYPVLPDFHSHTHYEIYYFHEGDCTYLIGNRIYRLEPGDMLLMYGMTLHRPKVSGPAPYVRSFIHFDPEPLRAAEPPSAHTGLPGSVPLLQPFEELRNYRLQLRGELRAEAEELLLRMHRHQGEEGAVAARRLRLAFEDLLCFVYERCREPLRLGAGGGGRGSRDKEAIAQEAMDYVERHLSEELELGGIASELHVSRSYLSRTFKEVTGVALFDYIYRQRINQARIRFLLEPDASVTDVGYAVGFKHPAHFSRLFKRLMGVSPDRYRRGCDGCRFASDMIT